jgi:hypothetical protein
MSLAFLAIAIFTLSIMLWWRIKKKKLTMKKTTYKNNKLTSYMLRPSRGHLQADILVVGSGILLVGVLWLHIGCINVKIFYVTLQCMSCILLNMFQVSA